MSSFAERSQIYCLGALFFACAVGEGLSQAALGVLAAACLFGRPDGWFSTPVAKVTIGLVLWCVLTILISPHGFPRSSEVARLINLAPLILVPVVLRDREKPTRVLWPFLVGLALASVYAFFQYRYGVTFGAKLSGAAIERWQELAPGSEDRFVAGGFFYHRLKFAHALVIGLLAAVFTLDRLKWPVAALLLCALWLTFARAAFVAFVIAAGLTLLIERRIKLKKSALLLFVPVAIAASMPGVLKRLGSLTSRESYGDRAFIWERASEIVRDNPWFGVGYGNYSRLCSAYYDRVDPTFVMRSQAHNQFLTFWAETGPVGALLFAALLVFCFVLSRRQVDASLRAFATSAVIATGVLSLVHDPLAHGVTAVLLCASLGMAGTASSSGE